MFGRRPFRGRSNSDLTYSISKDPLKWPEDAEKKCSRGGMQVLKGVSSVKFILRGHYVVNILYPSFWSEILPSGLVVSQMGRDFRNYNDTRGSNPSIGIRLRRRSRYRLSYRMCVDIHHLPFVSYADLTANRARKLTSTPRTSWKSYFWRITL